MSTPFVLPEALRRSQQHSTSGAEASPGEGILRLTDPFVSHYWTESAQTLQREFERATQLLNAKTDTAVAALIRRNYQVLQICQPSSPLKSIQEADRRRWREISDFFRPTLSLLPAHITKQEIASINRELARAALSASTLYSRSEPDPPDDLNEVGHDDVVIHASPASQTVSAVQPDNRERLRSPFLAVGGRNLFSGVGLTAEPGQSNRLEKHLEDFLSSDEVGSDPNEGIAGLIAWINFKGGPSGDAEGRELNRLIRLFIRRELQLDTPTKTLQITQHSPSSTSRCPLLLTAELGGETLTSQQLARKLTYNDSTIRREAFRAFQRGPLPQQLKCAPDWFVVDAPASEGGRGKGWKLMQRIS